MYHANLILFILIGLLCSTITSIEIVERVVSVCGKHEIWMRCGKKCPKTCDSPAFFENCPMECVAKCRCRKKYVRGPSGECIRPSQCDPNSLHYKPEAWV